MKSLLAMCVGLLVATLAVMVWTDRQIDKAERERKQRESILLARVAEAELERRTDSVEVVKWATKTVTLRDSLLVHKTDTLLQERFIYQTDTLRLTVSAAPNRRRGSGSRSTRSCFTKTL